MFDIGFLELVLVAVIALLVLGPERLPVAARTAGTWIGKAKRMVNQFTQEIDRQVKADEIRKRLEEEGKSLNVAEDVKKIQDTVGSAMDEARQFETLTSQNILPEESIPNAASPLADKAADKTP